MKPLAELSLSHGWNSFLDYRNRRLRGVPTGIDVIDKRLQGLGGVTIIQGAPGSNKSTLALQIATHNAGLGFPALIIDRENGLERFRLRVLCQVNRVSTTDVLTCDKARLKQYVDRVRGLPLYVCTGPVDGYKELNQMLSQLLDVHKKPCTLVIDSLQKMPALSPDRRASIDLWLQHVDQLKLNWEGRLTSILVSEKSRGAGGINYEAASLSAAKESGGVDYTGELILDLRRNKETGSVICEVVKNRDGVSGVAFDLDLILATPDNAQSFCFRLGSAVL